MMSTPEATQTLDTPVSTADILPWNIRLVPAEPTPDMVRAALDCQDFDPEDGPECEMYYTYLAMLAAAPRQHVPMLPVGYLIRTETGTISGFNEESVAAKGCLPPGWTEEALFTPQSVGVPVKAATAPKLPEMSVCLFKVVCEALLDENPVLTQEHAEELTKLLAGAFAAASASPRQVHGKMETPL